MNASIQYLENKDLDKFLWDACIDKASNGLIYAYSYYLDKMCIHWDALVLNDYEAVMPLPWKQKWGIKYVCQVPFIQRLGVFGNASQDTVIRFFAEAARKFPLMHYNVSEKVSLSHANFKRRTNFFIPLHTGYEAIQSGYSKECITNIEKAKRRGCVFTREVNAGNVIGHFQSAYGEKNSHLKKEDYQKLEALFSEAKTKNAIDFLGVANETEELIYSAVILKDKRRLYYVLGAPTAEGRTKRATYFFIDHVLEMHAGTGRLFDFEGSDIPAVSGFYQKFGPQTETYYELKVKSLRAFL